MALLVQKNLGCFCGRPQFVSESISEPDLDPNLISVNTDADAIETFIMQDIFFVFFHIVFDIFINCSQFFVLFNFNAYKQTPVGRGSESISYFSWLLRQGSLTKSQLDPNPEMIWLRVQFQGMEVIQPQDCGMTWPRTSDITTILSASHQVRMLSAGMEPVGMVLHNIIFNWFAYYCHSKLSYHSKKPHDYSSGYMPFTQKTFWQPIP